MMWIQRALIVVMIMLGSTAHSQRRPDPSTDVRAPVNVAYKLYSGCMQAHFDSTPVVVTTKKSVVEFLDQLDDKCLAWMVIWYQPLMGESFQDVPQYVIDRFAGMRQQTISNTFQELVIIHNIKK